MEEEPMKISELIEALLKMKEKHGDVLVYTLNDGIPKTIKDLEYIEAENNPDSKGVMFWI